MKKHSLWAPVYSVLAFIRKEGDLPPALRPLQSSFLRKTSVKGIGKVRPRTGREGSEGEYMYSSTLSLISGLDGGGWLTPPPCRFTPGR
jgi:hypothetical protein